MTIPIPNENRRKRDLTNDIDVVLKINIDGMCKIRTLHGLQQMLYCRCFFISSQITQNSFLTIMFYFTAKSVQISMICCRTDFDICTHKFIQQSQSVIEHLVGTGQSFMRCTCTKNCARNRCQ